MSSGESITTVKPILSLDNDTFLFYRQEGINRFTGTVRILNTGGGVLIGSLNPSVTWIQVVRTRIETPYLHIITFFLAVDKAPKGKTVHGTITISTNGGSRTISIELQQGSTELPRLTISPRRIFLHEAARGTVIRSSLSFQNTGGGVISGTILPRMPWIQSTKKTFQITDTQDIHISIISTKAPDRSLCSGFIDIESNGGNDRIFVIISFAKMISEEKPCLTLSDSSITIIKEIQKKYQEHTITIRNSGTGTLTGSITSSSQWLSPNPSRFQVRDTQKVSVRIHYPDDTHFPQSGTLTFRSNGGSGYITFRVWNSVQRSLPVVSTRRKKRKLQLYDEFGVPLRLTATGSGGGEGEIFLIDGKDHLCAKIFHQNKRTSALYKKIDAMVNEPPRGDIYEHLTWPASLLFESPQTGSFAGYVMQRINTKDFFPLHRYYDPQDRISLPGSRDTDAQRSMLYRIAQQLASIIHEIHAAGHCIGDLRETNIFASVSGTIILIDCDSFQIRHRKTNRIFYSEVATGEYLPPELLSIDFSEMHQDRYYADLYALSVLIFKLVMDGVHPFQAKGPMLISAPTTIDKVRIGCFSFAKPRAGITPPDYAPDYRLVPHLIASLFSRCFIDGYHIPSRRPTAEEWYHTLNAVLCNTADTYYSTSDLKKSPYLLPAKQKGRERRKEKKTDTPCPSSSVPDTTPDRCYIHAGKPIILGNRLFSSGKRNLHVIKGNPHLVATIWKKPPVPDNVKEKILLMVNNPPPDTMLHGKLSWPVSILYNDRSCSFPLGYTTQVIDRTRYFEIHTCYDPADRIVRFTEAFSFRHLIATGANLAGVIASLHAGGHRAAGSMNERSVLVSADCSVILIHSDLFQIQDPCTGTFLCSGPLNDEMTPPELFSNNSQQGNCDYYAADLFALGVLLFRLLMDGVHPFMTAPIQGPDRMTPGERIQKGLYPYTKRDDILPPVFAPQISRIPSIIRDLFDACFIPGHNPTNRPSARMWYTTLNQVYQDIIQCTQDKTHWYLSDSGCCPWCKQIPEAEEIPEKSYIPPPFIPISTVSDSNESEKTGYLYHLVSALLLHLIHLPFTPDILLLPAPHIQNDPHKTVIAFPQSHVVLFILFTWLLWMWPSTGQSNLIMSSVMWKNKDIPGFCLDIPRDKKTCPALIHEREYKYYPKHEEQTVFHYHGCTPIRSDELHDTVIPSNAHQNAIPRLSYQVLYKKADRKRAAQLMQWFCSDRETMVSPSGSQKTEDTDLKADTCDDMTIIDEFYWYSSCERQKGLISSSFMNQEHTIMPDPANDVIPLTIIPVMVVPVPDKENNITKTGENNSSHVEVPISRRVRERIRKYVKRNQV